MKYILVLSVLLGLSACKFNQDPMEGKAEEIRKTIPPAPPAEKPKEIDSNLLQIDGGDEDILVTEQNRLEFELRVRILDESYGTPQLEFENLSDFPGASYDVNTKKFSWTPELGTVGADFDKELTLRLRAIAYPLKDRGVFYVRRKNVQIRVKKLVSVPQILSVKSNNQQFYEGRSYHTITIEVEDKDALDLDTLRPQLFLSSPKSDYVNLAPFAQISSIRKSNINGRWTFTVDVDLSNAEIVKGNDWGRIDFMVLSPFYKWSAIKTFEVQIYNNFSKVVATLLETMIFKVDIEQTVTFQIYDPKAEGNPSLDSNYTKKPEGSTLTCTNSSLAYVLNCNFVWKPAASDVGSKSLSMKVINSLRNSPTSSETDLSFNIKVE